MVKESKAVAILMAPRLGDTLLMMVVAENFRQNGWRVTVFGNYAQQLRDWFPGFEIFPKMAEEAAGAQLARFDLVVQMHPDWPFALRGKHPNYVVYDEHVVITGKGFVKAQQIADFCADYFGFANTSRYNGMVAPAGARKRIASQRVVIHPTSTGALRCWEPRHFRTLARYLIASGFEPAFIVSPEERPDWVWVEALGAALPPLPSLSEVAAYIHESGWFIGNESGIGHLASSVGLPVLTLTGRVTRTKAWRPAWGPSRIVAPWYIPGGRLRDRYWRTLLSPRHVMWAFARLRARYGQMQREALSESLRIGVAPAITQEDHI